MWTLTKIFTGMFYSYRRLYDQLYYEHPKGLDRYVFMKIYIKIHMKIYMNIHMNIHSNIPMDINIWLHIYVNKRFHEYVSENYYEHTVYEQ